MIAMKNAASGATYIPAARITRMAARSRRWLATDKAMADRARTGPSTPSHNAESTLNHCASVGSASVSHANKNPSENCQIKNTARMTMTMRRTPSVLSDQFLGMYDIATALLWSQADAFADLMCKPIANQLSITVRYQASQYGMVEIKMPNQSAQLATERHRPAREP